MDLKMVLFGKSGTGKSSTGNTILQRKAFESGMFTVTSECHIETGKFEGQKLAVIDTPCFFNITNNREKEKLNKEMGRCVLFAAPGPHVILIVIQPNRFTDEQNPMKFILGMFGEQVAQYTMVLFTHGDELEMEKVQIQELINANAALSALISQCKGRYHVFNNNEGQDPSQVRELLQKINMMVKENGGSYNSETLQRAERAIINEMGRVQRENPETGYTGRVQGINKLLVGLVVGLAFIIFKRYI